MKMKKEFCKGDKVEVCIKERGFEGSYYEATVLDKSHDGPDIVLQIIYEVQFKNLVDDFDPSMPLVDCVFANDLRPLPPKSASANGVFSLHQKVDAFDNDGWWVGKIEGKTRGSKYWVYFETTGERIAYPASKLRNHVEWCDCKWVSSKNCFV